MTLGFDCSIADIFNKEGEIVKKCGLPHSLIAAADTTSALSGLLLSIPFINRSAAVAGDAISDGFYGGIDFWTGVASRLLPPAVAYISAFFAAGYLIAFIYELLKHINGEIRLGDGFIRIRRGFIWSLELLLREDEISACTSEQGLLCMILGIKKLFLLSGTGKKTKSGRELLSVCKGAVSPPAGEGCARPSRSSVFSFMLLPLALLFAVVCSAFYFWLNKMYIPLAIIQCIAIPYLLIWTLFRIAARERTYFALTSSGVSLGTYRGLRIISAELCLDAITRTELRQNPLQRLNGGCNLRVYVRNTSRPFKVKRLKIDDELLNFTRRDFS